MELFTVDETARILKVSSMTVRRYISMGKLPAVRVGRGVRVEQSALASFVTPVRPSADETVPTGQPLSFTDMSTNHDRYLAEAYADTHE